MSTASVEYIPLASELTDFYFSVKKNSVNIEPSPRDLEHNERHHQRSRRKLGHWYCLEQLTLEDGQIRQCARPISANKIICASCKTKREEKKKNYEKLLLEHRSVESDLGDVSQVR